MNSCPFSVVSTVMSFLGAERATDVRLSSLWQRKRDDRQDACPAKRRTAVRPYTSADDFASHIGVLEGGLEETSCKKLPPDSFALHHSGRNFSSQQTRARMVHIWRLLSFFPARCSSSNPRQ